MFYDITQITTEKLLNHGLLVIKLKSSLPKFNGYHHDLVNHYRVFVTDVHGCVLFVVITVHSSFMTYHSVSNKSKTRGNTCGAGTSYPSGAPEFIPGCLVGFVLLIVFLYIVLYIIVCSFSFGHCIV
jgi:hypothetical protein